MLSVNRLLFLKKLLLGTALLITLIPILSCNKPTEPPSPPKTEFSFELNLADVYCTEVWLNSNAKKDINIGDTLLVISDDSILLEFIQNTLEEELYIDGLLPGKEYIFYLADKERKRQSDELKTKTLDTTDHNYTWQKFEFGEIECGSSYFYDVAIVDENNIWAVGSIKSKDSLGNCHTQAYNAVHWDGDKWELKRIMFYTICGQTSLTSYPAKSIFVFNDGEIWISSSGDKIAILKKGIQIDKFCLPSNVSMSINKLWGSSTNNLYAVGDGGNIVHWNGSSWTKIESGTTLNINDIYGDGDDILCVAANVLLSKDLEILKISNLKAEKLPKEMMNTYMSGIWYDGYRKYYVAGGGVWKSFKNDIFWTIEPRPKAYYMNGIRGTGKNRIVSVGALGEVLYYNGVNWKSLDSETLLNGGKYVSVDVKDNVIVAAGIDSDRGVIMVGRK